MPKKSKEEKLEQKKAVAEVADWMVRFINANESTLRPVLDIQHIELLLLAFTLSNARRFAEFGIYLAQLLNRLSMRRHIWIGLPFVDGCNNLENVFEQVATRNADKLITDESSYLVLMLLELSMLLDEPTRGKLILGIHRQLVEGVPEKGAFRGVPAMNLMSWIPPEDWEKKVLQNYVDDGEAVAHGSFLVTADGDAVEIMDGMKRFVRQMREACHRPMKTKLPLAPFILASLRHKSPLPPELWRNAAFPKSD